MEKPCYPVTKEPNPAGWQGGEESVSLVRLRETDETRPRKSRCARRSDGKIGLPAGR